MAEFYKDIPIIDTDSVESRDMLHPKGVKYGYAPRDYKRFPERLFDPPSDMQIAPESEWDARFDEQEETESSLEHIFLRGGKPAFVNLDQNGDGHCWCYSTGQSYMLSALRDNRPVPRLNPHFCATYLREFNGGWGGLSAKLFREIGCLEQGDGPLQWPLHSNNTKLLTPDRVAAAKQYRTKEEWTDLTRQVYDQNLTKAQVATCGFNNIPGPRDYDFWSHSVSGVRWVRIERGSWGQLILNSWLNWGRFGLGVLRGSQAICDGGLAIRTVA